MCSVFVSWVSLSSPPRGMWIEITIFGKEAMSGMVIPPTGDVD